MIARLLISPSLDIRKEAINLQLKSHLEGSLNIKHPDILYFKADDKLGIEQARKIKSHFSLRPYSAKGRVVVLEDASVLTPEAQNSLLKVTEELPEEALLILAAGNESAFLPTLLSRCQLVYPQNTESKATPTLDKGFEDIEKVIHSSVEDRFRYIEGLKDKDQFLKELIAYFHQNLASHFVSENSKYVSFLKELLQAEQWAKQNVNIRAVLEYLMLVMPSKV